MSHDNLANIGMKEFPVVFDELDKKSGNSAVPNYHHDTKKGAASVVSGGDMVNAAVPKNLTFIEFSWTIRFYIIALLVIFIGIGATYFWAIRSDVKNDWLAPVMTVLWLLAGLGVLSLFVWMWRRFSSFANDLSVWANQLLEGDFSSRIPIRTVGCPTRSVRKHINTIAEDYERLSYLQQKRLSQQQRYIEQKKHYLSVLYDVASCINKSNNLEELLQRFLHTLTSVVKAKAATVRLLDKDNQMRLVASIGLSDDIIRKEEKLPAPDCLCGMALNDARIMINSELNQCSLISGQNYFADDEDIDMLAIPLAYRGNVLGVYNLFVHRKENDFLEGEHELLESIGQHLGMAIEKASVEEDARTLSIIEERTRMAHELHDSLAQTLASMRYKVRLLDDSLNSEDEELIWTELEGLETIIDEANNELRSLMKDFRAPFDGSGIVRSIERLAKKFQVETGVELFFHKFWHLKEIPKEVEIEVIRIVQEALTNIRKHSQAKTVRILMYSTEKGDCKILVEDDGIGLDEDHSNSENEAGEHIGLSVMKERAARINGEIQFECDDGEGTLIQLSFMTTPEEELV